MIKLTNNQKFFFNFNKIQKQHRVNNQNIIKKINNGFQQLNRKQNKQNSFGFILCGLSFGIFILWKNQPYNLMFKHFSINEYIFQKHYYHAIILQTLSFPTNGNFIVYFPLLLTSCFISSKLISNKQIIILFLCNSVVTTFSTYYYEKIYLQNPRITPKFGGCSLSLSLSGMIMGNKPNFMLFGSRFLPFFILPTIYLMYEVDEFQKKHVNEVSRPANISAFILGFIAGLIFRLK